MANTNKYIISINGIDEVCKNLDNNGISITNICNPTEHINDIIYVLFDDIGTLNAESFSLRQLNTCIF